MAVVTGTVAAGTAAGGATAGASASTGGATMPAGATITQATAAKRADSIRRLASVFIRSAEMKAVSDSELVDEFAAPIYAGLSAVPVGSTPTNTDVQVSSRPDSPVKDLLGTKGEAKVVADKIPDELKRTGQQMPLTVPVDKPHVMLGERPEIKELVDKYYDAPTIKDQLEAGNDQIVVERNLLEGKVTADGDKRTAMCLIEERVVDRKYLEHGNLTDLISEVRHGNVPTIRQIYLAIIDLTDLATFKVFSPLLARVKLEPATYRLRQLTADFERKSLESTLPRGESDKTLLDRKVEKRSWFKTDHVTEKIDHRDVETSKQLEIAVVNVTNTCTIDLYKDSIDAFMARRAELADIFAESDAIARIENTLPREAIASINKSAMAWVQENVQISTSQYTTVETFNRYWTDLGGFLGKKIEMSDKHVTNTVKSSVSEYLSASDIINLNDIKSYQQAMEKFAPLQKTMSMEFDPKIVETYIAPGEGVTFDEGWITYIPGGSIVNLGVKVDLGSKLTGWDFFWAGVDVASIALAVVTFGASSGVVAGTKTAGVAAGKGVAKVAAKGVVKTTIKQTGRIAVKNVSKIGAKAAAKQTGRVAVKATAKATTKKAVKGTAKAAIKTTAKGTVKPLTVNTAKKASVAGARDVPRKGAKAGVEGGVKQIGKIKISNPGRVGTKAKLPVDVSTPDVTYKNIPRTGKYDGIPGDSLYHPNPKAVPSNPKVNPHGKTNARILKENGMKDGIPFEKGYPDFSPASKATVDIEKMGTIRSVNMGRADSLLAQQVREGKVGSAIERNLQKMGVDLKKATKGDISRMRKEFGLTWHEHQNKHTMQLIQKELHGTVPHKGGISALKEEARLVANGSSGAAAGVVQASSGNLGVMPTLAAAGSVSRGARTAAFQNN